MGNQAESRYTRKTAIFIVVAAMAVVGLAPWATADAPKQGRGPCAEDFAQYCKDVPPGGGRMATCLKEHENDFSAACKEHIAQVKERSRQVQEACKDDSQRLCKDVQPGGGRLMKCLKAHEAELSPACREKLPKARRGK